MRRQPVNREEHPHLQPKTWLVPNADKGLRFHVTGQHDGPFYWCLVFRDGLPKEAGKYHFAYLTESCELAPKEERA
jgi:hypothetical protein